MEEKKRSTFRLFSLGGMKYRTHHNKMYKNRKPYEPDNPDKVTAFIPGTIVKIYAKKGKKVKTGDRLLILEAMKMKNDILSPHDGVVKEIFVKLGDIAPKNFVLLEVVQEE